MVLRSDNKTSRVIVEVEDGEDAVGDTHWYRFDFFRSEDPSKNLADARAAYAVLQDLAGTLYRKSRAMEQIANESSAKTKQLEARLQAQTTRLKAMERSTTESNTRAATESSAKVKQLEARLQAQAARIKNLEQTVFESSARAEQLEAYLQNQPDPQMKEKETFMKCLLLAADQGTTEHERHTAALRARDLMKKHDLLKLQRPSEGNAT